MQWHADHFLSIDHTWSPRDADACVVICLMKSSGTDCSDGVLLLNDSINDRISSRKRVVTYPQESISFAAMTGPVCVHNLNFWEQPICALSFSHVDF
ncbi:hypothetical protein HNR39_003057 [Glaciimonas immobilis]|uniref:Uncharacterized protein n=1 Tax=Glaciimonas immobilis TaxID=728004 RepID=A0A840RVT8_9BURK|nr:hypothetical protein [Glaciimonas immobilis]